MYYVSNKETFDDICKRCRRNIFDKEVYPKRFYSENSYLCISKKRIEDNREVYDGVFIKQVADNEFETDTFKGVTERFVLINLIGNNKLTKHYQIKHPKFCEKFKYLMKE